MCMYNCPALVISLLHCPFWSLIHALPHFYSINHLLYNQLIYLNPQYCQLLDLRVVDSDVLYFSVFINSCGVLSSWSLQIIFVILRSWDIRDFKYSSVAFWKLQRYSWISLVPWKSLFVYCMRSCSSKCSLSLLHKEIP